VPIRDIKQPIGQIHPGTTLDKIFISAPQSLLVPPNATHRLDWDFLDQTIRIFDSGNLLCTTFEGVSSQHISSACFADQRTLVTGSTDSTISLWRFAWLANGGAHLQQIEVLRGHSAPITCLVASRTLSIVVSGAEDGFAMIWDLNRALLVHSLPHSNPVSFAAIVNHGQYPSRICTVLTVVPYVPFLSRANLLGISQLAHRIPYEFGVSMVICYRHCQPHSILRTLLQLAAGL
jgi:hypothetical protein